MHERIRRLATSEALACPQTCVLATRLSDRKREVSVGSDNVESLEGRNQILKVSGEDRSGARDSGVHDRLRLRLSGQRQEYRDPPMPDAVLRHEGFGGESRHHCTFSPRSFLPGKERDDIRSQEEKFYLNYTGL